jgi:hypothetical protein
MNADAIIVAVYVTFDQPADRIVADPRMLGEFAELVNRQLPESDQFEIHEMGRRLLNLRRRGQANGGLPRLRRGYYGRGETGSPARIA